MNYPMDFAKICVVLMLSLSSKCEGTKQVRHSIPWNSSCNLLCPLPHGTYDKCVFIACQYLPLRQKFMECCIINPALSILMKHLVIGQRQKAPDFSAFHWSPQGSLVSIGQHFVTTRIVHLPKKTETS